MKNFPKSLPSEEKTSDEVLFFKEVNVKRFGIVE
jgi:hypothetical protein